MSQGKHRKRDYEEEDSEEDYDEEQDSFIDDDDLYGEEDDDEEFDKPKRHKPKHKRKKLDFKIDEDDRDLIKDNTGIEVRTKQRLKRNADQQDYSSTSNRPPVVNKSVDEAFLEESEDYGSLRHQAHQPASASTKPAR